VLISGTIGRLAVEAAVVPSGSMVCGHAWRVGPLDAATPLID
jgi:hypothetical protein